MYLYRLVFSELPAFVAWCLTLNLENSQSLFQILLFPSFPSLFGIPMMHMLHLLWLSSILGRSGFCFGFSFWLSFQFGDVYSSSGNLSSAVSSLLLSPSWGSSLLSVFRSLALCFVLRISISQLALSICSYLLATLPTSVLGV